MKIFSLAVFCVSCFFCSWVLHAAHKEKREETVGKAMGMVRSRSEEALEAVQEEKSKEGKETTAVASQSLGDFIKDLLGKSSVKKGLLSLSGLLPEGFFGQFSSFSKTKQLVLTRMSLGRDDTVPFTNALKFFSALEHLAIRQSTIDDGMFFFLGMQVPKLPMLRSLMLEENECTPIGWKSFLIGVSEADQLKRFSWRHMPLSTHQVPWEIEGLLKKKKPFWADITINVLDFATGVSRPETRKHGYVKKTPLRFLFEDALPRLRLEHLDLSGSIIVKNQGDREELMGFLDTISSMGRLKSLALSDILLDEFSARSLSRALVRLQEEQLVKSNGRDGRVLQNLDLAGVLEGKKDTLKDLESGLKASRHLVSLNLARNTMGAKAFSFLMVILPDLRELKSLNLSNNDLFVGKNSSMIQRGRKLGEAFLARKDTLKRLNLSENGMEDKDLLQMKDFLLEMDLETLDLRDNLLTDHSVSLLKEISTKKDLKNILVSRNKMTEDGLKTLEEFGIMVNVT